MSDGAAAAPDADDQAQQDMASDSDGDGAGAQAENQDAETSATQDAMQGVIIEFDGQEIDSSSLPEPERRPLDEIGKTGFMFAALNDRQRQLYADMLFQMRMRHRMFLVSYEIDYDANEDWSSIYDVIDAVLMEHPELFWICSAGESYPTIDQTDSDEFFVGTLWNADEGELDDLQADLDRAVADYLLPISDSMTEYDKVLFTYDYVMSSCQYDLDDWENPLDQSIRSVLLDGKSVCAGYARTMEYLLGKVGVECWYVPIDAEPDDELLARGFVLNSNGRMSHACDIVRIGEEWYYLDATYGDDSDVPHYYMTMTSTDLDAIGHDIAVQGIFPECKDTIWDYYHVTGWFMSSASAGEIQKIISEAIDRGCQEAPIKCDSRMTYEQCVVLTNDYDFLCQVISDRIGVPPGELSPTVVTDETCRAITISW